MQDEGSPSVETAYHLKHGSVRRLQMGALMKSLMNKKNVIVATDCIFEFSIMVVCLWGTTFTLVC